MIRLPNKNKEWIQTNNSDIAGSIYTSYNIDASELEGKVRAGKRLLVNVKVSDLANLGVPVGFKAFTTDQTTMIFTAAGARVFRTAAAEPQSTFVQDSFTNTPTTLDSTLSDIEYFPANDKLYVTATDGKVYFIDNDATSPAWGSINPSLSGSVPHMLCTYGGRMYCTDLYNKIISWDSSDTIASSGTYTVTITTNSAANVITCMRPSANRIWICTVNTFGGPGYVYEWDGVSTQVQRAYKLESSGALACVIKDDIPYIIDTNGDLLVFNGGAFQKLTGFYRKSKKSLSNALSTVNNRFIHPNGMTIVDGKINIFINGSNYDNTTTQDETIPSGVYEYDSKRGLIHKHSVGLAKSSDTISDFGASRISKAGAIESVNIPSQSSTRNGTFVLGCEYYTDATTTTKGIFYDDLNDTLQKAAYFITPQLEASNVTDIWQKLFIRHKKLLNSTDKIVVKYRTTFEDPVEATITWASTTTFTVPNSSVVVSNYWTSGTGGEVEVIQGTGAGRCAHITSATLNAGTWTVTVDETFTGASSQTAKARFNKWIKLKDPITDQVEQYHEMSVGTENIYIQLKVWMLFTGKNEIHGIDIINAPQQQTI